MSPLPVLETRELRREFTVRQGLFAAPEKLIAVDSVDLTVLEGETLGIVGESGSGKSTLARLMLGLYQPTKGEVLLRGKSLAGLSGSGLRAARRDLQIVFQDPYASLNPRMRVLDLIAEPIRTHEPGVPLAALTTRVGELLRAVGLDPSAATRFPHEFSGGQRQRIGIARAIALKPKILVLDEPVSALDVSIQAQIVNLLKQLQREFALTYVFVAHDLAVVRLLADRVAVMYLGRVVEIGTRDEIFNTPLHPYTHSLLSAVPLPNPDLQRERRRIVLSGEIPSPTRPPPGCTFHTRCPIAQPRCKVERPALATAAEGPQRVACFYPTPDATALTRPS